MLNRNLKDQGKRTSTKKERMARSLQMRDMS